MAEEKIPKGLMAYVPLLEKQSKEVMDEETKRDLRDLLNQLSTLHLSKGLSYTQTEKLKESLLNDPLGKDEYSDYSFIPNLRFFFDSNYSYTALSEREVNILSDCIFALLKRINDLHDELDDMKISEVEKTEEKKIAKEKPTEDKKETTEEDDDLSVLEEDEEFVVLTNFIFECLNCGSMEEKSYLGGCKKCGNNQTQVHYVV